MKIKIKTALVSVSNKAGLEELVSCLTKHNINIISTGGTAKFIKDLGIKVTDVSSLTNFPEMMDGRVKTLHPKVFGGILNRSENLDDVNDLKNYDIPTIDLVIVDLYPFEKTVESGESEQNIIEKIDINLVMIKNGCAWFYRRYKNTLDIDDQVMYDQAEIFAIENKKGLFSNQEAEAPWVWRKKN